jgi:hypothetical protein
MDWMKLAKEYYSALIRGETMPYYGPTWTSRQRRELSEKILITSMKLISLNLLCFLEYYFVLLILE